MAHIPGSNMNLKNDLAYRGIGVNRQSRHMGILSYTKRNP